MKTSWRSRVLSFRALALILLAASLFAACDVEGRPQDSGSAINLINSERGARGLHGLSRAGDLDFKAQDHAERMARENRLSHTPITRGIQGPYSRLGENVGVASSISGVHAAFMRSASHRKHILDGGFSKIGVGVARASNGNYYIIQIFKG